LTKGGIRESSQEGIFGRQKGHEEAVDKEVDGTQEDHRTQEDRGAEAAGGTQEDDGTQEDHRTQEDRGAEAAGDPQEDDAQEGDGPQAAGGQEALVTL